MVIARWCDKRHYSRRANSELAIIFRTIACDECIYPSSRMWSIRRKGSYGGGVLWDSRGTEAHICR